MRVAFLVGPFPKISKTFILDQITGLIERGVDLDVFAEIPESQAPIHPDFLKHDMSSRIVYPYGNASSIMERVRNFPRLLASHLRSDFRALFRTLNFFRYGKGSLSLEILYQAQPFFQRAPYHIIHAHFGPYGVQAHRLRELDVLKKGKLVTSFHGIDISAYLQDNPGAVYNSIIKSCDLFLPVSEYWKNKLVGMGCDENRVEVHHMGVDCENFAFKPKPLLRDKKVILLSIGRLTEKKGFRNSIHAVSSLIRKGKDILYNIVGDGPLKEDLSRMTVQLEMQGKINLIGWKNRKEVVEILNGSDILVAPSVTAPDGDMEGIPMVLMEAMASGVPVVSTEHSGIPELVIDCETGLLVPEGDEGSLSGKIELLMDSPRLIQRIQNKARKYVDENFNVNKQNDRLLNHYERLLSEC